MKVIEVTEQHVQLIGPIDLELSSLRESPEWPVCRPVDLSSTHGVNITLERLQEMADSYDPEGIEAAAINIDHELKGPAHGWVEDFFVRDGMLWAKPVSLSEDLTASIESRRLRRQSIEFTTRHPETGGWYPHGLAILGSKRSAVKSLPSIQLSEHKRFQIRLESNSPELSGNQETAPSPGAPAKEVLTMTTDSQDTKGAAGEPSNAQTANLEASASRLDAKTAELDEAITRAKQAELSASKKLAQLDVEQLLSGKLAKRVTPGMRKAGAADLLIALKASETPLNVELSEGDGTKPSAFDALVGILESVPEFTALGMGEMATDDGASLASGDPRTPQERQICLDSGLSDEAFMAQLEANPWMREKYKRTN